MGAKPVRTMRRWGRRPRWIDLTRSLLPSERHRIDAGLDRDCGAVRAPRAAMMSASDAFRAGHGRVGIWVSRADPRDSHRVDGGQGGDVRAEFRRASSSQLRTGRRRGRADRHGAAPRHTAASVTASASIALIWTAMPAWPSTQIMPPVPPVQRIPTRRVGSGWSSGLWFPLLGTYGRPMRSASAPRSRAGPYVA